VMVLGDLFMLIMVVGEGGGLKEKKSVGCKPKTFR